MTMQHTWKTRNAYKISVKEPERKVCIKPSKPKFVKIIFKNSVCTAKKIPDFTITKIN
jgi:hypothetical protein